MCKEIRRHLYMQNINKLHKIYDINLVKVNDNILNNS